MADSADTHQTAPRPSRRGRWYSAAAMVGIVALALVLATLAAGAESDEATSAASDEPAAGPSGAPDAALGGALEDDFADALGERLDTEVAPDDVEAALRDVLEARLDAAVEAGQLTRDQADAILDGLTGDGEGFAFPRFMLPPPGGFEAPRPGPGPFPFGEDPRPAPQPRAGDAFLGVSGTTVDPEIVDLFGLDLEGGAILAEVGEDTPAAAAGLQRRDVITAVDGETITTFEEFAAMIAEREPGDAVSLTVVRAGEEMEVDVELGSRPASETP